MSLGTCWPRHGAHRAILPSVATLGATVRSVAVRPICGTLLGVVFLGNAVAAQEDAPEQVPARVAALLGELADDARPARAQTIAALGALRAEAVAALPALTACLQDHDPEVVAAAVHALGKVGPYGTEPESIIEAIALHAFPDPRIGGTAPRHAHSLGDVGRTFNRLRIDPQAKTGELIDLLRGDLPFPREFAAELLAERQDPDAIDALREAVVGTHPIKCRSSWRTAGTSGSFSCRVDAGDAIRAAAARALVATAPQRAAAAPGYAWLLQHGTLAERRDAAMTLGRLGAPAREILDALRAALGDDDVQVLREAITSLSALGPVAAPASAQLRKLQTHTDEQIRRRAAAALRQIER